MERQPYQMTSIEFYQAFPLWTELSARAKWRLYRICEKVNLQETGESSTYEEFVECAIEFRWDVENGTVLWHDNHSDYVKEALQQGLDVPSDTLDEYPDLVEEQIKKRIAGKRTRQKRLEYKIKEKRDRNNERKLSTEDKRFWSQF